jgi:microcystin-dependent protein
MDEFIGVIRLCSGMYVPEGFLPCNGQQLPINQYPALFAVIGITYGGDGTSYFNLPNFNGRAPVHAGTAPGLASRTLGQSGGVESVTMTTDQMPAHSHPVAGTNVSILQIKLLIATSTVLFK